MNRKYIIILCVMLLCIIATCCSHSNTASNQYFVPDDYIGLTYDAFDELIPKEKRFDYLEYSFFEDNLGNPCVAFFSGTTISECYCYSRKDIDTSAKSFESIQPGMTLFEVVAKVGLPDGSFTFGMATVYYETWRGVYTITIDTSTSPATVQSIELS